VLDTEHGFIGATRRGVGTTTSLHLIHEVGQLTSHGVGLTLRALSLHGFGGREIIQTVLDTVELVTPLDEVRSDRVTEGAEDLGCDFVYVHGFSLADTTDIVNILGDYFLRS
jgi:hypothetical protein